MDIYSYVMPTLQKEDRGEAEVRYGNHTGLCQLAFI
jgi:hypothetical protein